MSKAAKSCYIRSIDPSLSTVYLPDCTETFVGRSPETKITDPKCSRQQVRLYANYTEYTVLVQQIATRPCGVNGFKTTKDVKLVARHNDNLDILYGQYSYQIEFNPPPVDLLKRVLPRKRSYEVEDEPGKDTNRNSLSHKMPKLENGNGDKNVIKKLESLDNRNNTLNKPTTPVMAESENNTSQWESIQNGSLLIYIPTDLQHQKKIAAYDMDTTLIKTKSGLVRPKDCNDWQLLYPEVPGKLKKMHAEGYKIVIFTNQASLGSGKVKVTDFKQKIERIVHKIGIPIQVFIAVGYSIYRKPCTGMWDVLANEKNGGVPVDKSLSIYIGDAAGRPKDWAPGKKKDHSFADRLFALNLGLKFETPEEHFLGQRTARYMPLTFDPRNLPQDGNLLDPPDAKVTTSGQEMILMVGAPGSGKSHFAKIYLSDYGYVNRDTLGSWQKCVSALEDLLRQGKSVVVDNTNPNPVSRERYISIAKKHNIPVRCFVMNTSTQHTKHNNKFRELSDTTHVKITDLIINSYVKNYIAPTLDEGFVEIVKINFIPKFHKEQDRKLYEMFLLEH